MTSGNGTLSSESALFSSFSNWFISIVMISVTVSSFENFITSISSRSLSIYVLATVVAMFTDASSGSFYECRDKSYFNKRLEVEHPLHLE